MTLPVTLPFPSKWLWNAAVVFVPPEYKKGIDGPVSVPPEKAGDDMIKFAPSVELGVNDNDGDDVMVGWLLPCCGFDCDCCCCR